MTRSQLVLAVAARTGLPPERAAALTHATFSAIAAAVRAGEHVHIRGFGRFYPSFRPGYASVHPRTGAPLNVAECVVVRFRPSAAALPVPTEPPSDNRPTR